MIFKILFNPLLLPAAALVAGFVFFKMAVQPCGDIAGNANIFVLTGDIRRIPFALKKLEHHPKRKLYIIGAGAPRFDTEFDSQIDVESTSKTTYENAVAIRHIVHKNMMGSIVVITTVDHMNRAMFLIKQQLPYIVVEGCPVPLSHMPAEKRLERWITEYVKFIGTFLGVSQKG